jgi:flagellar biosynthesis protein FlhF
MRLGSELVEMRRQMQEIQRALTGRQVAAPAAIAASAQDRALIASVQDRALAMLRDTGIDEELATEVVDAARDKLAALPDSRESPEQVDASVEALLGAELGRRLRFAAPSNGRGPTASIIAFIGPPGSGKTTSLVKMALLRAEKAARPVHFISADSHRVGAAEQLRTYASILGAGIDLVDSPKLLAQSIEANLHRETILIDTPGLSGEDFDLLNDLAEFLAHRPGIEKHLVLPATMRFRDLRRCLQRYETFSASGLLFTHLDETDRFGALCSAALWSGLPLSFLSGGQQIPEDLEEATHERLLRLLFAPEVNENGDRNRQ